MLRKLVLGATALALCLPAAAVLAHDYNEEGSHGYYGEHGQDYGEHRAYHDADSEGYGGYYNREDDGAWRERQREAREAYQENHRDRWRDRYAWRGNYGAQYGYPYGAYNSYYGGYRGR